MLSIVHAAEMQFRHDATTRDRELALLGAIHERETARAAVPTFVHAPAIRPTPMPARVTVSRRAAWPRPIGAHARLAGTAGAPCATC